MAYGDFEDLDRMLAEAEAEVGLDFSQLTRQVNQQQRGPSPEKNPVDLGATRDDAPMDLAQLAGMSIGSPPPPLQPSPPPPQRQPAAETRRRGRGAGNHNNNNNAGNPKGFVDAIQRMGRPEPERTPESWPRQRMPQPYPHPASSAESSPNVSPPSARAAFAAAAEMASAAVAEATSSRRTDSTTTMPRRNRRVPVSNAREVMDEKETTMAAPSSRKPPPPKGPRPRDALVRSKLKRGGGGSGGGSYRNLHAIQAKSKQQKQQHQGRRRSMTNGIGAREVSGSTGAFARGGGGYARGSGAAKQGSSSSSTSTSTTRTGAASAAESRPVGNAITGQGQGQGQGRASMMKRTKERAKLMSRITKLKSENAALKERCEAAEQAIAKREKRATNDRDRKLRTAEAEVTKLRSRLREQHKKNGRDKENWVKVVDTLRNENKSLAGKRDSLGEQLLLLQGVQAVCQAELEEFKDMTTKLQRQNEDFRQSKNQLTTRLQQLHGEFGAEKDALFERIAALEAEVEQSRGGAAAAAAPVPAPAPAPAPASGLMGDVLMESIGGALSHAKDLPVSTPVPASTTKPPAPAPAPASVKRQSTLETFGTMLESTATRTNKSVQFAPGLRVRATTGSKAGARGSLVESLSNGRWRVAWEGYKSPRKSNYKQANLMLLGSGGAAAAPRAPAPKAVPAPAPAPAPAPTPTPASSLAQAFAQPQPQSTPAPSLTRAQLRERIAPATARQPMRAAAAKGQSLPRGRAVPQTDVRARTRPKMLRQNTLHPRRRAPPPPPGKRGKPHAYPKAAKAVKRQTAPLAIGSAFGAGFANPEAAAKPTGAMRKTPEAQSSIPFTSMLGAAALLTPEPKAQAGSGGRGKGKDQRLQFIKSLM